MSELRMVTLGELAKSGHLEIGDGYRTKRSEHGTPGVPILRVAEVLDGRIEPEFVDFVSERYRSAMGPKISRPGDVILTTKGTVGRVAIMPADSPAFVYSPQVCYFRTQGDNPLASRYLYYWFKSEGFWSQARSLKSQTDMADYINLADIRSLEIFVPARSTQAAMVEMLGALDDKIAINDRIMVTSDELCGVTMSDLLQDDLEISAVLLSDIADVNKRKAIPVSGGSLRYIDISSVSGGRVEWPQLSSWDDAPGRARRGVSPGDVIWSTVRPNRKSFALILDNDPALVASTGFAVLTPAKVGSAYLYEATKRDEFVQCLESVAEGSAYPAVRAERFGQAMLPLPSPDRLEKLESIAMPLRRHAHAADVESRALATLRDALLPGLMSGEIRVRAAEKIVEDVT